MLQYVAVCCSVLQCVAVCCSVLQCVAVCCNILQCVVVLQCAPRDFPPNMYARLLKYSGDLYSKKFEDRLGISSFEFCSVVQRGVVWCTVVQCGAM